MLAQSIMQCSQSTLGSSRNKVAKVPHPLDLVVISNASFAGLSEPASCASLHDNEPILVEMQKKQSGGVSFKSRMEILRAIQKYDTKAATNKHVADCVCIVDERQPQPGSVIRSQGLKGLFQSLDWKQKLCNDIVSDDHEFECRKIDENTMQVHVDCIVNRNMSCRNTLHENVLCASGQPDENSVRWFAAVIVKEIPSGEYEIEIKAPCVDYFTNASGTGLKQGQTILYRSNKLPDGHLIAKLSPWHACYGE